MVFVSRLPAPYREPLLQRVSELPGVHLTVLYEVAGREGTAWKAGDTGLPALTYERRTCRTSLRGGWGGRVDVLRTLAWGRRMLDELRPDLVVVHGYSFPLAWSAIRWIRRTRTPYALRSDTNVHIERVRGWWLALKRRLLGELVRGAQSILCIGAANRAYWSRYGASAEQFAEARYAVDQALFSPAADGGVARHAFRERHGLGDRMTFLFVGRLIPRKNLPLLLDAFRAANAVRPDIALVIAGDGPDHEALDRHLAGSCPGRVVDLGLTPYARLPDVYRACDVLVCPYEREPWGLTINEAMSCGLPVVAAGNGTCGAAVDLVRDGRTGLALAELSAGMLAAALLKLAEDRDGVSRMGACARALMAEWTYETAASGFAEAARRAVGGPNRAEDGWGAAS